MIYSAWLVQLVGRRSDVIESDKPSLGDLIQTLVRQNDKQFAEAIIDSRTGGLLPGISLLVNEVRAPLSAELRDGDEVTFLFQLGGG